MELEDITKTTSPFQDEDGDEEPGHLDDGEEVSMLHGLQGSQSLLVVVPASNWVSSSLYL